MADTLRRLLRLLSLLQSRPVWSGPELAERLEVTDRTIRRDVERLRELGYPVTGEQGAVGGYRLGPGARLPPLVLEDDEAVAIAVALRQAAGSGVEGLGESALRGLTKLDQVLPARLAVEVEALTDATSWLPRRDHPEVAAALLTDLAAAVRGHRRVRFSYRSGEDRVTERDVLPYRLLTSGRLWYLFADDPERQDWRTFRLDRMSEVYVTSWTFTPREAPDPVSLLGERRPWPNVARLRVRGTTAADLERHLGSYVTVTTLPQGDCLVEAGASEWTALAWYLGWTLWHLGAEVVDAKPADLVELWRDLGQHLVRWAGPPGHK
ncbi:helix-turn-helix transcriptional regulator [Parenemella sanctibonifatiensis]|uniref:Transcriptional regulator n=1 Tax=Parenemella sanctibonifatiensis TaxID=2016505 RepID=A0A255EJT7_9ACTN|nr:YafY family protein [Parenemella sanctibonifatiensis]OYN89885.1 transcriptional regulator [Parenemella sanctibonifatiensis]